MSSCIPQNLKFWSFWNKWHIEEDIPWTKRQTAMHTTTNHKQFTWWAVRQQWLNSLLSPVICFVFTVTVWTSLSFLMQMTHKTICSYSHSQTQPKLLSSFQDVETGRHNCSQIQKKTTVSQGFVVPVFHPLSTSCLSGQTLKISIVPHCFASYLSHVNLCSLYWFCRIWVVQPVKSGRRGCIFRVTQVCLAVFFFSLHCHLEGSCENVIVIHVERVLWNIQKL